jgi:hypothetical protein
MIKYECPVCGYISNTWIKVLKLIKELPNNVGKKGGRDIIQCHIWNDEEDKSIYDRDWKSDKPKEAGEIV